MSPLRLHAATKRRPSPRAVMNAVTRRAVFFMSAALGACAPAAPPSRGEVLVVIDTDLPIPRVAGRVRVDVYSAEGTWFESRDMPSPREAHWPLSFSVYNTPPAVGDKRLLVRVRVYPEGLTRRYEGERWEKPERVEPPVARTFEELCANAPELKLGGTTVVRRGLLPIAGVFGSTGRCLSPITPLPGTDVSANGGSAAAWVEVPTAGDYTFAVLATHPTGWTGPVQQTTVEVRRSCDEPTSSLGCDYGIESVSPPKTRPSRLDLRLSPGRYWVVASSFDPYGSPADILLAAARTAELSSVAAAAPGLEPPFSPKGFPLDLRRADRTTPDREPLPSATVDRLVLVELREGVRARTLVVLRGACAGVPARLGTTRVDFSEAATCVDDPASFGPVTVASTESDIVTPGRFFGAPFGAATACPPADEGSAKVCVEGGVFVFGGRSALRSGDLAAAPERIAALESFSIDRHEVTVARYREALAAGLGWEDPRRDLPGTDGTCKFRKTSGNDDFGVNCVSWATARAFCRFMGGDLPTEAQWEWVATVSGRAQKTLYPWGDDPPRCSCEGVEGPCHAPIAYRRGSATDDPAVCAARVGTATVFASQGPNGDVTPLGVVGLGGGLTEWVLDEHQRFDSSCWLSAPAVAPACRGPDAPTRVTRGGFEGWAFHTTIGTHRSALSASFPSPSVGFRCVYPLEVAP